MLEWVANQLIKGTMFNNESVNYEKSLEIIKKIYPEQDFKDKKKKFDSILVAKGSADLIKK